MRGGNSFGHLHRPVEELARRDCATLDPFTKRFALEQLGDQIGSTVVSSLIEHDEKIRMIESACSSRFLSEACKAITAGGELGREKLDRNVARDSRIVCTPHLTHPPRADWREHVVRSNPHPS